MAMGTAEFEVSRYAITFSVVSSGSMVMPTVLIRVRRPFVRRWAVDGRDGRYTPSIVLEKVVYVGMEELTDEEYRNDKAKARDWMSEGRKLGFFMPLQVRCWRDVDEMDLWRAFAKLGTPYMDLLKAKKPDIADDIESVIEQEQQENNCVNEEFSCGGPNKAVQIFSLKNKQPLQPTVARLSNARGS